MKIKILDHSAWTFDPETGEPLAKIENHIGPFNSKVTLPPVREVDTEESKTDCGCK